MNLRLCQWLAPLMLLIPGCATDNQPDTATVTNDSSAQQVESGAPIKVKVAAIAEVEQLIAKQNGKVVVLDLWALW